MKKISFLFVFAVIASLVFSGCDKYDEGPTITFKSNVSRITGTWTPTKQTRNGIADTYTFSSLVFDKSGVLTVTRSVGSVSASATGTWAFGSDDEIVVFTYSILFLSYNDKYTIKRLSSSQMYLEYQSGSDLYRYEFEKK